MKLLVVCVAFALLTPSTHAILDLVGGLLGSGSGSGSASGGARTSGSFSVTSSSSSHSSSGSSGGGMLGLDGLLSGLTNGGNLLGSLGQTVQGTLGGVTGSLTNLVNSVLQLVQNLVDQLAEALRQNRNVQRTIAFSAAELVANVEIDQLGAAVEQLLNSVPSLDADRFVIQVALNLNAENALRFLLDIRARIRSLDLPRIIARITSNIGVSAALDIAILANSRFNLSIEGLISSIIANLPLDQITALIQGAGARFGPQSVAFVQGLTCQNINRLPVSC